MTDLWAIIRLGSEEVRELQAKVRELEAQLPEGMKHCTILAKECDVGHSRLTAANWTDLGCHWCMIEAAEATIARVGALKPKQVSVYQVFGGWIGKNYIDPDELQAALQEKS